MPEPIRAEDDGRLTEWGYGITNLIPRMTPGIDTLRPEEYAAGLRVLRRKIRRWRPRMVVFLGVTLFRVVFARRPGAPVALGLQKETFEGAAVFVLPNPSGRNANYSYARDAHGVRRSAPASARKRGGCVVRAASGRANDRFIAKDVALVPSTNVRRSSALPA